MAEPTHSPAGAENERIAKRATEIAEELRHALPRNTDFEDGWQQRYMDRQNARFEKALEMAREEARATASAAEADEGDESKQFRVTKDGVLRYADGTSRPATEPEKAMWQRLMDRAGSADGSGVAPLDGEQR